MSGSSHGSCCHSRSSSVVRSPTADHRGPPAVEPVLQHTAAAILSTILPPRLGAHLGLHHRLVGCDGRPPLVEGHHRHAHNGSQRSRFERWQPSPPGLRCRSCSAAARPRRSRPPPRHQLGDGLVVAPSSADARQHRQRRGDRAAAIADGDADALRPEIEAEAPRQP